MAAEGCKEWVMLVGMSHLPERVSRAADLDEAQTKTNSWEQRLVLYDAKTTRYKSLCLSVFPGSQQRRSFCPNSYNKLASGEMWIRADSPWLAYHCAWCQTDVQLGSCSSPKTQSLQIPESLCPPLLSALPPTPNNPDTPPHTVPRQSPSLITSTQGSPDR